MKVALAPALGGDDLVIGRLNELLAAGIEPPPVLQHLLGRPGPRLITAAAQLCGKSRHEAANIAVKRHYRGKLGPNPPHPPAAVAARFAGAAWDDYTKFCFVRNPYERVASDYFWRRRSTGKTFGFKDFLQALARGHESGGILHKGIVSNWDMMTIDGKMIVDRVGRYETLHEDFHQIVEQLGLGGLSLKSAEKRGSSHASYGELYGPEERALVAEIFRPELEHFGYEFPYGGPRAAGVAL